MNDEPSIALGIDLGGTKIAVGLVRFPSAEVLLERTVPTEPGQGGQAVLNRILNSAESIVAEGRQKGWTIESAGLGVCELIGPDGAILSHNCILFNETEAHAALKSLGPLTIEADVRAAARAEALFGAGRGKRIFLYLTIGTGISCCLVLDGKPFLGARGLTGTIGSSSLSVACDLCGQVNRNSLEQIASGPALVARYRQLTGSSATTGHEVLEAAAKGELEALRVLFTAGEALEATVGLIVNVLDPEAVVIGGGLGLSEGPYWDAFIAATRRHIWSEVHRDLPILRAQTGVNAGLIGAAAAAWENRPLRASPSGRA